MRSPAFALGLAFSMAGSGLAAGQGGPAGNPPPLVPTAAVEKLLDPGKEFNVIVFVPSWWVLSKRFKRWETDLDDYARLSVRVLVLDEEKEALAYGLRGYPTVVIYREGRLAAAYEGGAPEVAGRPRWVFAVWNFLGPALWELGGPVVRLSGEPDWSPDEGLARARSERSAETQKAEELKRRLSLPAVVPVEPGRGFPTAEEAFRLPWVREPAAPR